MFRLFILLIILTNPFCQKLSPEEEAEAMELDCRAQFQTQKECETNKYCKWAVWNPAKCNNNCNLYDNHKEKCLSLIICYYNEETNQCYGEPCIDSSNEKECLYQVACRWDAAQEKCVDESCLVLMAKQERQCLKSYCRWNAQRQLCYDKFCSDYVTMETCQELSFCKWSQYKCLKFDQELEEHSVTLAFPIFALIIFTHGY